MTEKPEWLAAAERQMQGEMLAGQRFLAENDPEYMQGLSVFLAGLFGRSDNLVGPQMREMLILAVQASSANWDIVRSHIRRALAIDTPPKMILETLEIAGMAGGAGALYGGAAILGEELEATGRSFT